MIMFYSLACMNCFLIWCVMFENITNYQKVLVELKKYFENILTITTDLKK